VKGDLNNPATTPSVDPQQSTPTPNYDTPTPTPTPSPTPTPTSDSPTSTPTSDSSNNSGNSNSGGGTTYTGQGTFYSTGLGACGITNNDGQKIAAVSHEFFDSYPGYDGVNPNNNPLCGKMAYVTYQGKSVEVALTDRCEGCSYGDLDFSPTAFSQLADQSVGRIDNISWSIEG
jgi:expansin (peptidoglycan-binding protein)